MSEPTDRIPCPHCQASNFPTSATCWQCGQPLRAESQPPAGTPPPGETPPPAPGVPPPIYPPSPPPAEDTKTLVILGFVFAALGLLCCPIFGIVAVIMGILVLRKGNSIGTWIIVLAVVLMIVYGIAVAGQIAYFMKHPEIFKPGSHPKYPFPIPGR